MRIYGYTCKSDILTFGERFSTVEELLPSFLHSQSDINTDTLEMTLSIFDRAQSSLSNPRTFQYAAIISGICCPAFFFAGFIAAGFIPPLKPSLSAEQTAQHYRNHEAGVRVGASLLLLSGMFYLPYTALITSQMERIPHVPRGVSFLQLGSGAAGIFTFMVPAMILAVTGYRVDRDANMTQILNDAFWVFAVMPFPTFIAQNWAFSYAIFCDDRSRPLFPRYVGVVNVIAPLVFAPALGLHAVKSGPIAWNGALTFWLPAVCFGLQFGVDAFSLFKAVKIEDYDLGNVTSNRVELKDSLPVASRTSSGVQEV
jgi:hypothetical protein